MNYTLWVQTWSLNTVEAWAASQLDIYEKLILYIFFFILLLKRWNQSHHNNPTCTWTHRPLVLSFSHLYYCGVQPYTPSLNKDWRPKQNVEFWIFLTIRLGGGCNYSSRCTAQIKSNMHADFIWTAHINYNISSPPKDKLQSRTMCSLFCARTPQRLYEEYQWASLFPFQRQAAGLKRVRIKQRVSPQNSTNKTKPRGREAQSTERIQCQVGQN